MFSSEFELVVVSKESGQRLQRSFPHKQQLCALVNNVAQQQGKSDNNAAAVVRLKRAMYSCPVSPRTVCDGKSVCVCVLRPQP